jgi:hypothetical protein
VPQAAARRHLLELRSAGRNPVVAAAGVARAPWAHLQSVDRQEVTRRADPEGCRADPEGCRVDQEGCRVDRGAAAVCLEPPAGGAAGVAHRRSDSPAMEVGRRGAGAVVQHQGAGAARHREAGAVAQGLEVGARRAGRPLVAHRVDLEPRGDQALAPSPVHPSASPGWSPAGQWLLSSGRRSTSATGRPP